MGVDVHFFAQSFAYVAKKHIARLAIEAGAKGITQTIGPYFLLGSVGPDKWVVGWNGVAAIGFDVDAQDLAKIRYQTLGVTFWLVAGPRVFDVTSVATADIEIIGVARTVAKANPTEVVIV